MPSSFAIGEHFEKLIDRLVESGRYNSRSEVVREGLRVLEDREDSRNRAMQQLEAAFQEGIASGDYKSLEETFAEVRAELDTLVKAPA
jgi:antitoxin ParD1/3/4